MLGFIKKYLGSMERLAANRARIHLRTNPALVRMKYSFFRRSLERFLNWSLFVYVVVIALFLIDELLIKMLFSFPEKSAGLSLFGKEAEFLSTQITAVGLIFPIAVSLVTVILERSNATRLDSDIKLYNHASLTYAVGASCFCLVVVYILSLFFSTQGAQKILSHTLNNSLPVNVGEFFEQSYIIIFMPLVQIWWLVLNLLSLWYFLKISLIFVQPSQRLLLRQKYAANVLIPSDIKRILMDGYYRSSKQSYLGLNDDDLSVNFSFGYDSLNRAVTKNLNGTYRLHDIWMRPLSFVIRRWLNRRGRVSIESVLSNSLFFPPSFSREYSGEVIICECRGNTPLTALEKSVIRICFRFKKVRSI